MRRASQALLLVKNPPVKQETHIPSPEGGNHWRIKWQPTPVFLPGESHGQRSLVGYSPWGHKELDTTRYMNLFNLWFSPNICPGVGLLHPYGSSISCSIFFKVIKFSQTPENARWRKNYLKNKF